MEKNVIEIWDGVEELEEIPSTFGKDEVVSFEEEDQAAEFAPAFDAGI